MPKDTFNNLSEEKKRRIFDAAVQEFSTQRFSEASINQIVKMAEIPRGSFYQYFSNKEDVFLYMSSEIAKETQAIVRGMKALDPDSGIFDEYLYKAKISIELYRVRPQYKQISLLMEKDDSEFIVKLRNLSKEDLQRVKELFERDKERGIIKPEIDSELIIDMIHTLTLKEFFRAGMDEDTFFKKISAIIGIIKTGISCESGRSDAGLDEVTNEEESI